MAPDAATLLDWVIRHVPARPPVATPRRDAMRTRRAFPRRRECARVRLRRVLRPSGARRSDGRGARLRDLRLDAGRKARLLSEALYEGYALQSIRIAGREAAPDPARAIGRDGVGRPAQAGLPPASAAAVVSDGLLSDAQLESVIYAGEAHSDFLAGSWTVDATFDTVSAAPDDAENAVRFRRGWMLGDGTGAGKGRQVAGILLDNWLKGRRRAVWVSKSDKLIEDAQRDWSALGQERLLVTPLARFAQGHRDPPRRGHPLHHLRDPALGRARGESVRACSRSSIGSAATSTA